MPTSPVSDEGGGSDRPDRPSERAREQADESPPPASSQAAGPPDTGRGDEERLAAELERTQDRYKRALADLDNYRKRTAREVERRVLEREQAMLRDWLEAVDSVERALRMNTDGGTVDGLKAVRDQMEAILARHGVRRLGEVGERFDPERHEAVDVRMTDEVPDQTIIEIARSGFALGDLVLRPAEVVVSRATQSER